MRCAGLFMIVQSDKAVLLRARQAYDNGRYYGGNGTTNRCGNNVGAKRYNNGGGCGGFNSTSETNVDRNGELIFLEKISIPRGKRDGRDIFDYETAVREFIEETATFFETASVYRLPFVLQWMDAGVTYKYSIYVGVVNGLLKTVLREPNTFCVKLRPDDAGRPNEYRVNLETRRFNNELLRHLYIPKLDEYFQYMNDKQLVTYDSSNYLEFFSFVKYVKLEFDSGRHSSFFILNLKLEAGEQWTAARPSIVLATKRELKNIVNIA